MGLFGKKKISEREAVGQFIVYVSTRVKEIWPFAVEHLKSLAPIDDSMVDDLQARYELVVAVISIHTLALPAVMSTDLAIRIQQQILKCLNVPEQDGLPLRLFDKYSSVWNKEQGSTHKTPYYCVAPVLIERLGLAKDFDRDDPNNHVMLVELYLTKTVHSVGEGWWVDLVRKYNIVQ